MRTPTAAPIDSPVLINIKTLPPGDLQNFITKNETFGEFLRKIGVFNRVGQYSNIRLTLLQPTKTTLEKDGITSMKILQRSSTSREKFLRLGIRLQQEAGMDVVTVPFIQLPFSILKKLTTEMHRDLTRGTGGEPLFFVDVNYHDFESVIHLLVDDLECQIVGLIQRRYSDYPLHYDYLRKYYDHDVAFMSVQTSRFDENFDDISTMHYLPFLGNDIYAVKVPKPFYDEAELEKPSKEPRLSKIRFFDKQSLKVKPAGSFDTERVLADIRYQDQDIIRDMLDNREEVNGDNAKFQVLNSFSKVHELNTSQLEFQDLRTQIGKSETQHYIDSKQALKPLLAIARKRAQTTLNS